MNDTDLVVLIVGVALGFGIKHGIVVVAIDCDLLLSEFLPANYLVFNGVKIY